MSVEDWARREAEQLQSEGRPSPYDGFAAQVFAIGAKRMADALLSDEAILAIQKHFAGTVFLPMNDIHAALEAAVRAVTEGDTK